MIAVTVLAFVMPTMPATVMTTVVIMVIINSPPSSLDPLVPVGGYRRARRRTNGATDDGGVTPTRSRANRRTGGATQAATYHCAAINAIRVGWDHQTCRHNQRQP